ncbi:Acyl-CoA 6-desaturase [Trichinella pseudospiralis]
MAILLNAPVLIPKNAFQRQTYCPLLRWEQCEVEECRFSRWFSIGRLIDNRADISTTAISLVTYFPKCDEISKKHCSGISPPGIPVGDLPSQNVMG